MFPKNFPKNLAYISGNYQHWDFHFNLFKLSKNFHYHYIYSDEKNEFIKENNTNDLYEKFNYIVEEFLWETFERNIYRR